MKVRIPLKQIAGGPQPAQFPEEPDPGIDPEEELQLLEEMVKFDKGLTKVSKRFAFLAILLPLLYLIGRVIWILAT